ncbi:hypothetical protein PI125_g10082 [Phytophthora idaei]|nr:hypothetical protein PI125_g10082 [Phytophthora idaei]
MKSSECTTDFMAALRGKFSISPYISDVFSRQRLLNIRLGVKFSGHWEL